MNDIHATILETFFFGYIDRNIGADETPLFTRTHEGEPLSSVIARRLQLKFVSRTRRPILPRGFRSLKMIPA